MIEINSNQGDTPGVVGVSVGKVIDCDQPVTRQIYSVRGVQVMIDRDLARLYEVEPKIQRGRSPEFIRAFIRRPAAGWTWSCSSAS